MKAPRFARFALPLALTFAPFGAGVAHADPPSSPSSQASPKRAEQAPSRAVADVLVIHATKEDGGAYVDPKIGQLPNLGKKPFSDYSSFKLIDKQTLALEKGRPASYALVTGRSLRLTLHDVTADKRYAVEASLDQPGKSEFLKVLEVTAAPNERFFVGGQSYQGGVLILAITIRPAS